MNKINVNDPGLWQSIDWDDPIQPDLLKKTDTTVNRSRSAFFKKGNKVFSETMSAVAAERGEEYLQALHQGIANRDNTYQAICNARPEVRKKISAKMKAHEKTQEHLDKVAARNRERAKPVRVPWGVFESGTAAGVAYNELHGVTNGKNRVSANIKKGTPGYEFITQKQYEKLKNR
jgi:hypothetical protein